MLIKINLKEILVVVLMTVLTWVIVNTLIIEVPLWKFILIEFIIEISIKFGKFIIGKAKLESSYYDEEVIDSPSSENEDTDSL